MIMKYMTWRILNKRESARTLNHTYGALSNAILCSIMLYQRPELERIFVCVWYSYSEWA